MRGKNGRDCDFCDLDNFREASIFIASELCFFVSDSFASTQVLPGAGVICPIQHRESPFALSREEWLDTQSLLALARQALDSRLQPDGYNLIWNVQPDGGQEMAHAHLHLIPRFHDEPYAGRGGRWLLKQPENRRSDPLAPGLGRAISG